ncbi:MAG: methyltransferase domain-containing protein [Deltaproteobacteria bacterium]|nr:methyltransferase domain-containing protein [Deltaproteobacteria bacterium]
MSNEEKGGGQRRHWNSVYADSLDFFGEGPSAVAESALEVFRRNGAERVLELGFGQGRDTFLFAREGLEVTALDYSETAVEEVRARAAELGLAGRITALQSDLREPLSLPDRSVDACFAHMLLCMEFSSRQIEALLREIHRVLRPGGVLVYSVRSTFDKHYRAGTHLAEDLYEVGGFAVHFFSEAKIRQVARGYEVLELNRVEEGSLPRDLFVASLRKVEGFDFDATDDDGKERDMGETMDRFQGFFDAAYGPGVLDRKTKHLLALSASLATGCDS